MPESNQQGSTRRDFVKHAALGTAAMLTAPARVLGANDRVQVGIIGAGARGTDLLQQLGHIPNVELIAIADAYTRNRDVAKRFGQRAQTFDDHRRLLAVKEIDAVIVATPLHLHAQHFVDTVTAGKDLYCEKTMTWSIPEAEQCLEAAKKSDRVVQIGLQHESSGALADAKRWIAAGVVGKVTQVNSWMSRNTPHGKGSVRCRRIAPSRT